MLGHTYRYQVYNGTGVSVTVTVKDRPFKFASGVYTPAAEATHVSAVSVATVAYETASTVDNSSVVNIGSDITAVFAPASSATGTVSLFLQRSTDGGTTWPDTGLGQLLGSHTFSASATSRTKNFTVR